MSTTSHTTSRGFKHWSDRDDAAIREMFHEGYSDDVIAGALGRTVKAIELRRIRLELRNANRPRATSKPPGPRPLTSGQLSEIQRHLDGGLDAVAIAALMSLPERTVQQAISNHHMIAMPPRNAYRPPSVRTVQPEPAPAAEPFEHRMLHPDAPISLPVTDPGEELFRSGELLSRIPEGLPKGAFSSEQWDGKPIVILPAEPEPIRLTCYLCGQEFNSSTGVDLACPSCASTAEGQQLIEDDANSPWFETPDADDDWEPYVRDHAQITGMVVVLRRGGKLALSQDAWQAIGSPEYVTLLYSRRRNSIGIRPSSDPNQPKVQRDGRMGEINAVGFARQFSLAFEGQRVIAAVEQGTLVVEVGA